MEFCPAQGGLKPDGLFDFVEICHRRGCVVDLRAILIFERIVDDHIIGVFDDGDFVRFFLFGAFLDVAHHFDPAHLLLTIGVHLHGIGRETCKKDERRMQGKAQHKGAHGRTFEGTAQGQK